MYSQVSKLAFLILVLFSNSFAQAEEVDKSRVPPISVYEAMLSANKPNGWVQFRNYDGRQYVYFSALQTLHCRLKEIRYSVNSKDLDKTFDLVPCNPQTPFSMPPDFKPEHILISYDLGTVSSIAAQIVWEDGRESEIANYEPCKNVGDQTCAWPIE